MRTAALAFCLLLSACGGGSVDFVGPPDIRVQPLDCAASGVCR